MPQALGHFALGMAMTTLAITVVWPGGRYPRLIGVVGGLWAMIPDIHWIAPGSRAWKHLYHDHPIANVNWFHHVLDTRVDPGDSDAMVAVAIALLLVVTIWAERRAYRRLGHAPPSSESST